MDKTTFLKLALSGTSTDEAEVTVKKAAGVPAVAQFLDADYWYVLRELKWTPDAPSEGLPENVKVPVGFVTDFASVPRVFWNVLPPMGRYSYAAILHDYLYWCQPCSRAQADSVLKACMEEMDVGALTVATIYSAVAAAGSFAWNSNIASKAAGERRILRVFPQEPTTTWSDWKVKDVFADCS